MGTIFVLRYGSTWETLKGDHTYQTAKTAAMNQEIAFFNGAVQEAAPKPRPKPDARTLDEAINTYLTTGKAAQENWRKHTVQCYSLALKLFRQSL
jgi:hypothetical protein